ncbi:MAG: LysE family transporter [Ignavibacteriales bacterium]|nr:LysE family transporter [Ignavibacteriales bacterium]
MTESLIVIVCLGLFAGFFFSVPIAGPISILITSNALKGNIRYCLRLALGGAIIEMIYVFIAVFGLTSIYNLYQEAIPVILIVGSTFLIYVAIKIIRTKLQIDSLNKTAENEKLDNSGGFRTGLLINLTNPSLFLGWFTSSFLLLSFASSIGLNTGGLDILLYDNVISIEEITGEKIESLENYDFLPNGNTAIIKRKSLPTLVLSFTYALMVGFGSYLWFFLLSKFLIKYKEKISITWLNKFIKLLGFFLLGISFYLIYQGFSLL